MSEGDILLVLYFCTVVAFSFLLWDMIITFADEVELVWGSRLSLAKFLYFFIRYSGLTFQTFDVVHNIIIPGRIDARTVTVVQAVGLAFTIKAVEIVLIMRVVALYNRSRFIIALLVVLFLGAVGTTGALGTLHILSEQRRVAAGDRDSQRSQLAALFWVPTIVFESLLFAMTIFVFPRAIQKRGTWAPAQIVSTFVRDGVWAFALLFVALIINQRIYSIEVHGEKKTLGLFVAAFTFCGYRLLLNVRKMTRWDEDLQAQSLTPMEFRPPSSTKAPHRDIEMGLDDDSEEDIAVGENIDTSGGAASVTEQQQPSCISSSVPR